MSSTSSGVSSKEADEITKTASRIASCVSILALLLTAAAYVAIVDDIEKSAEELEIHAKVMQDAKSLALDQLQEYEFHREKRQSWFTSVRQSKRGRDRQRERYDADDEPKVCDCTIIKCQRGPRGPPGTPGDSAIDGIPGEPGQKGVDGVFQIEGAPCPPCPRGRRGPDGLPGPQGEKGRAGIPGEPGRDGHNEFGPPGPKGNRGQSGRNGQKGDRGSPGQDFVQLVGVPGPKGQIGRQGLQGPRGDPGEPGMPAEPGPEGYKGPIGEPGDVGGIGERGLPGPRGPPGKDSGYCECPPRDGSGYPNSGKSNLLALSSNWEYYKNSGGRGKATITEDRPNPSEDYDDAVGGTSRGGSAIKSIPPDDRGSSLSYSPFSSSRSDGRFPSRITESRGSGRDDAYEEDRNSPDNSLISYKESSEQGINNRVVFRNHKVAGQKNKKVTKISLKGLDFEFKRKLIRKLKALKRSKRLRAKLRRKLLKKL